MMNEDGQPSKFWAYVAVLVGGVLLLAGVATTVSFLGLPLFLGGDILGSQLGQIAGMFLGLVCGSLALFHGLRSILKRRSSSLRLPPTVPFLLIFALVLGLGNLVINFEIATEFLFPPLFVLGAALPTFVVLAWAGRKLGWPITWRQGALAFAAGSTLSIIVAILLQTIFPYVIYSLLMPFEYFAYSFSELASGTSGFLDKLFSSPFIIIFFIITALQAPIPEEFAKALGITMFGRKRVLEERQAFMIGLASGAGFAILENMLYEGVYAQWSGWTWGGVTLIRGIGSVMHPLCTAIVALGWFRARKKGWGALLKAYFLAIGLHTLWNGGFLPFIYLSGLDYFAISESSLSVYGLAIEILLVVFLIALSIGLWWLLSHLVSGMAEDTEPELAPMVISPRALALWGLACVLLIVPIGAALGPAWHQIRAVVMLSGSGPSQTELDATAMQVAASALETQTAAAPSLTPNPTPSPTITSTATPTPTPTQTQTSTLTTTPTKTPTRTKTPTPTVTPTKTPTRTKTPTPTITPTKTPTRTRTPSPTASPTKKPTSTKIVDLLPSNACAPGESLIYIEDFQDNEAAGWQEINNHALGWGLMPHPETPEDIVARHTGDQSSVSLLEGSDLDNAVWRVWVMVTGRGEYFLTWDLAEPTTIEGADFSAYQLVSSSGGSQHGLYALYRVAWPVLHRTISQGYQPIEENAWHKFEVSNYEGRIEVWVDDSHWFSYQDPHPLPNGKVGFEVIQTNDEDFIIYFDDISICKLDAPFAPLPPS